MPSTLRLICQSCSTDLRALHFFPTRRSSDLNLPLVALTVAIMLIATIASWNVEKNIKGYFALLLILNAAIIGSFTALDFLLDRKSTRLNSSHLVISYAVFCLKKKKISVQAYA